MRYQRVVRLNTRRQYIVPVLICPPLGPRSTQHRYLALVDTGANTTAITSRVLDDCALPVIGQTEHPVATAGGMTKSHEYGLSLALELDSVEPPSQSVQISQFLKVLIASPAADCDVLLGMDCLRHFLIVAWESTMTIMVDVD